MRHFSGSVARTAILGWSALTLLGGFASADIILDVSPSLLTEALGPDGRSVHTIRLFNRGNATIDVRVSISDWTMDPDGAIHFEQAGSTAHSCASLMTLIPDRVVVPAGGTASVALVLHAPPRVFRGCWGVVLFSLPPVEHEESGQAETVVSRLSTTVYVNAAGSRAGWVEIEELDRAPRSKEDRWRPAVRLLLSNPGQTPARFSVQWQFKDGEGRTVSEVEQKDLVLLPGSRRQLQTAPDRDLEPGRTTVTVRITTAGPAEILRSIVLQVPV